MKIQVERILVQPGSTIGFGIGTTDDGTVAVLFAGDRRAMVAMGEALTASDEPIVAEVPEWAIIDKREL